MNSVAIVICATLTVVASQLVLHSSVPYTIQKQGFLQHPGAQVAHQAVVDNSYRESQLPSELRNDFYKDPKIADALAKESWFTSKEMPVLDREADKIPRERVYKIFKNAGWVQRRRR